MGREVNQRFAGQGHRGGATLDGDAWVGRHFNGGLGHGHAVNQTARVLLGRCNGCATAVGQAGRDDDGVGRLDALVAVTQRVHRTKLLVDDVKRKLDGLQRVLAPVFLCVLARVGVLERKTTGRSRVERGQLSGTQARVEGGGFACSCRAGTRAIGQGHGIGTQVVWCSPCAFVGVGHGTPAFQAPFTCGNATVHATRARRRRRDDAGVGRVEAGGQLHHQRHVLFAGAVIGIGHEFGTCHLALARADHTGSIYIGAVQRAVAASGGHVQHGTVVGVNGVASQLGCRGVERVGVSWGHG